MIMQKLKNSTVVLVVSLLVCMAFLRGPAKDSAIIAAFIIWLLYFSGCALKSLIPKVRRILAAKPENNAALKTAELIQENKALKAALKFHIERAIYAQLSKYNKKVNWGWESKEPIEQLIKGNSVKIPVNKIDDFNYVEVRLNPDGRLHMDYCKYISDSDLKKAEKQNNEKAEAKENIDKWFREQGRELIAKITCELSSAGYKAFYLTPDGSILVKKDGEYMPADYELNIPEVKFGVLSTVFKSINLLPKVSGENLLIEW